jgi:HAE1 family hydrophobic/amphiphilic exporter-1
VVRGGDDRLSVEIRGHDLAVTDALATEIAAVMKTVPGITFARPDREVGQVERVLRVDRARAAELGVGSAEVADAVEHYVLGRVATRLREGGNEYDIRVQLAHGDRERLVQLGKLPIVTAGGQQVPLEALVTIEERRTPSSISRIDQERVLRVDAGIAGRPLDDVVADLAPAIEAITVPDGMDVVLAGELSEQEETFENLLAGILLACFLVYAVMAVQFESARQPLIVMASVPFALLGVVLALLATATTFNMNSFLGAIVLVGIVVNNAIVLIDAANLFRRERGLGVRQAMLEAGRRRLRPILMTSLTTSLGLLPLALGLGEGSEMQAPLARAVIGGLSTSTLVTLVLVPCIYLLAEERGSRGLVLARAGEQPAE